MSLRPFGVHDTYPVQQVLEELGVRLRRLEGRGGQIWIVGMVLGVLVPLGVASFRCILAVIAGIDRVIEFELSCFLRTFRTFRTFRNDGVVT